MPIDKVPPGVTGFRGVQNHGKKGFRAVIEVDGARKHLGYFADPRHAAAIYDAEAHSAWGDKAVLNFNHRSNA